MFELIRSNKRRSVLLVLGFVLIVVAVGAAAGYLAGFGWGGIVIALVLAAGLPSPRTGRRTPSPWR